MQLKNIFTDEDAVSPVIGVILMVAITVILAAVIGAFVLGIGGSQETVPSASFSYEWDGSGEVTHQGGDGIEFSQISFAGDDTDNTPTLPSGGDTWEAGETAEVSGYSEGADIQVVWSSPSSDDTNIIGSGTLS